MSTVTPIASVGVDTTGDGRANYVVTGVDRNLNGIPDALETPTLPAPMPPPVATVGIDTTGDGRATYLVSGIDRDRNGIPDMLEPNASMHAQQSVLNSSSSGRVLHHGMNSVMQVSQRPISPPTVTQTTRVVAADTTYRPISPPQGAQVPQATIGIDTTGDGRPNYYYSGVDRNRDGIPDALQSSQPQPTRPISPQVSTITSRTVASPLVTRITNSTPMATIGVDTTGDGRVNYVVTGEDRNLDGIPDVLQHGTGVRCVCGNVFMDDSNFCRKCGAARFASELITGNAVITSDQRDGIICQMLGSGQVKVGFWKGLPEFKVYNISEVKKVTVAAA